MVRYLIAGLLGVCCMSGAWSQGYPQKPVRLVVPFAAGSATDTVARIWSSHILAKR